MEPQSAAFGREYRLLDSEAYGLVFKQGLRARSAYFKGLVHDNTVETPRLGMAVSRRAAKRAVDRNRIKRVVREYFRTHRCSFENRDFVILANEQTRFHGNDELRQSLNELFDVLTSKQKTASKKRRR